MPKPPAQMKVTTLPLTGAKLAAPLLLTQRGMPALDSIHSVVKFKAKYRIIKTTEVDSYEDAHAEVASLVVKKPSGAMLTAAMMRMAAAAAPTGDNFGGTQRKAAKLSIAKGATKSFKDVSSLIASLTPDAKMIAHKPKITTVVTSDRVPEEMRNVQVSAFLYAASRETDNDFHLIIGQDPKSPEMYMTMELSALPPSTSPAFATLNTARDTYKKFFGKALPLQFYHYYTPPIPVAIKGSLFFDMTHATGTRPGPASLKSRMPTIWEVHPITSIKLGP